MSDLRFLGEGQAWCTLVELGSSKYDTARRYIMNQTEASEEVNAEVASEVVESVIPASERKRPVSAVSCIYSFFADVRSVYRKVVQDRVSGQKQCITPYEKTPIADNGGSLAEKAQGETVEPQYDRLNDARWALRAWKRRRSDDQLKPHDGKHVAIYHERVWASDDDRDTAIQKALVEIRENEQVAVTEDDLCVDFWGPSGSFSVYPWSEE